MKHIARHFLASILGLWIVTNLVGGFHLANGWKPLLLVSAGLTLIHLAVRPVLALITGPLNFLTLGLAGLVLDSGLLYALTFFFREISIRSWRFPGISFDLLTISSFSMDAWLVVGVSAVIISLVRGLILSICDS